MRLLPLALFILLLFNQPFLPWWHLVVLVAAVALLAESGRAMLTSACRDFYNFDDWQITGGVMLASGNEREERPALLLTLFVTVGMVLLCIACGVWLVAMWKLFPQIDLFYPRMQTKLLLGFVLMLLPH